MAFVTMAALESHLKIGHIRHYGLRYYGPAFVSLKVPAADIVTIFLCVHWYHLECHAVFAEIRSLVSLVCTYSGQERYLVNSHRNFWPHVIDNKIIRGILSCSWLVEGIVSSAFNI